MAYNKTAWESGAIITQENMNKIENQLAIVNIANDKATITAAEKETAITAFVMKSTDATPVYYKVTINNGAFVFTSLTDA